LQLTGLLVQLMHYYLVDYRMKKYLFILLFFLGCETFDLKTDNPLDPNNPDYVKPTISILSPSDQQTFDTDKVDVTLQGNELVSEYRYKIVTSDVYKAADWSSWSSSNEVSLEFLNEYTYTVNAQSRYLNEETSENASVTFTVDALQSGSLLLYPRQVELSSANSSFKVELYAHSLSNVSALEYVIEFDPSKISFKGASSNTYGDVNVVNYDGASKVYYTIGVYNNQTGFDKDQLIAEISFKKVQLISSSTIKILSPTAKSLDGQTIEIAGTNQTRVDVK